MLPEKLLKTAVPANNEFGWKIEAFPEAVGTAISYNLACVGGQFQWQVPGGTCEAYWLNSDSSKKLESESWSEYVLRSNEEVLLGFKNLVSSVNFEVESNHFEFLIAEKLKGTNIENYLIFIAYFVAEGLHA